MQYRVFICHSYRHGDIYDELRTRLRQANHFSWQNESIPDDMLVEAESDDHLRTEIKRRISRSDVVLILTKPIATRSRWLREEIDLAKALGKPIVAITRRKRDKKARLVLEAATKHVDTWRVDDVTRAIREVVHIYRRRASRSEPLTISLQDNGTGQSLPPPPSPREVLAERFESPARTSYSADTSTPIPKPRRWWHRLIGRA